MGRKIPAKKHRGVKDPNAQQARRWQSIKGKINAPPKDPDEQPVPKSLTRLFSQHNPKSEDKQKKKKRKAAANISVGNRKAQNPVSQLRRLPGESGRSFSLRINGAIRALNDSAEDLQYPVDMEDEGDVKGERMAEQRRRRERKRRRRDNDLARNHNRNHDQDNKQGDDVPKLTRGQRLTLKKKAKKLKLTEVEKREVVYERVGFGEVAHAPPTLRFKRNNKGNTDGAAKGVRSGLLLSSMLQPSPSPSASPLGAPSPADAERRERARASAVLAYRALKAQLRTNGDSASAGKKLNRPRPTVTL
ncbi:unnamed protein product [Chilo suppressalis]|uniref:Coiled-coil domain-containing protein 137 n=1 Tax=Chilo suppressalis TaxID=168631 RepID=A0ABN8AWK1_CHISP|nr:unnamed protein product [Chilo suppressalis]